jgi:hypothetical protein
MAAPADKAFGNPAFDPQTAPEDRAGSPFRTATQVLFCGRDPSRDLATRQYARLVNDSVTSIGLDPLQFGMHSLRRTNAILI